jgi:hypothetical protein
MMSNKENLVMGSALTMVMFAAIYAGQAEALPEVIDNEGTMTEQEAHLVCQEYLDEEQKPCSVVEIDDRICYAYMELDGSSHPVMCFTREEFANKEYTYHGHSI